MGGHGCAIASTSRSSSSRSTCPCDNPPIRFNDTFANALLLRAVQAMRYTPSCAPIAYLALSIVAMGLAFRPRFSGDRRWVGSLVLVTWLFALPSVVLVPAADWRYALWPVVSAAVALLLALGGAKRNGWRLRGALRREAR